MVRSVAGSSLTYPLVDLVADGSKKSARYWYGGEVQLHIWHGQASDPVWTVNMPDWGDPKDTQHFSATGG